MKLSFSSVFSRNRYKSSISRRYLDQGIVYGALLSFSLIGLGILFGGGKILQFLDPAGIAIVLGGTIGATLIHFSSRDFGQAWRSFREVLLLPSSDPFERIRYLVGLSTSAKTKGMMVLDHESRYSSDSFLKLAFELAVDGQSPEEMRKILETEMHISNMREARTVQLFDTMGSYAPALGLIGTIIGLIQMLSSLADPTSVGPAMSVALVTTFYGAVFANLLFLPLAGKLRNRSQEEALVKQITLEGAISLRREENSVVLEQRLKSFVSAA